MTDYTTYTGWKPLLIQLRHTGLALIMLSSLCLAEATLMLGDALENQNLVEAILRQIGTTYAAWSATLASDTVVMSVAVAALIGGVQKLTDRWRYPGESKRASRHRTVRFVATVSSFAVALWLFGVPSAVVSSHSIAGVIPGAVLAFTAIWLAADAWRFYGISESARLRQQEAATQASWSHWRPRFGRFRERSPKPRFNHADKLGLLGRLASSLVVAAVLAVVVVSLAIAWSPFDWPVAFLVWPVAFVSAWFSGLALIWAMASTEIPRRLVLVMSWTVHGVTTLWATMLVAFLIAPEFVNQDPCAPWVIGSLAVVIGIFAGCLAQRAGARQSLVRHRLAAWSMLPVVLADGLMLSSLRRYQRARKALREASPQTQEALRESPSTRPCP